MKSLPSQSLSSSLLLKRVASCAAFLVAVVPGQQAMGADYQFAQPVGSFNWTAPGTWGGGTPGLYPQEAEDTAQISPTGAGTYYLLLDTEEIGIKSLTYGGDGTGTQYLYPASNGLNTTLTLGKLEKGGASSLRIGNGNASRSLAVNVGTLILSQGNLEIGQSTAVRLKSFKVSEGARIDGGVLAFVGVDGENQLKLGQLEIASEGYLYLGGRGNNTGVAEVTSLKGAGNIHVYGTSIHNGTAGTLKIQSTNSAPVTFTGVLKDGHASARLTLSKEGAGIQILSRSGGTVANNTNDYSGGTTITGGVLAISNARNDASVLGSGAVTVGSGGALAAAGAGTVKLGDGQTVTVQSGGRIGSGVLENNFSTLRLNGATNGAAPILRLEEGGTLAFNLGDSGASDRIIFLSYGGAGNFVTNGAAVTLNHPTVGVFTLFSFYNDETMNGASAVSSGLSVGALTLDLEAMEGFTGTFHYDEEGYGGLGTISVEIMAVPEPAVLALLPVGVALVWWRKRRATAVNVLP